MNCLTKLLRGLLQPVLRFFRLVAITVAMIGLSFGSTPLYADSAFWDGLTSGDWSDLANWDDTDGSGGGAAPGAVPTTGERATFDALNTLGTTLIDMGAGGATVLIDEIFVTGGSDLTFGENTGGDDTIHFDVNGELDMASSTNVIIDANVLLGDGSGNTVFWDRNGTGTLTFNGIVDHGTGTGTAGTQTLRIDPGSGGVTWNGSATNTGDASLFILEVRAGSGGLNVSSTGSIAGFDRFRIRNNGVATIADGGGVNEARTEIASGTLTITTSTNVEIDNLDIGNTTNNGTGDSFLIINGGTLTQGATWEYFDDTVAHQSFINGTGSIIMSANRNWNIDDNINVAGAEMTVSVNVAGNIATGRNLVKQDFGTLAFTGTMSQINSYVVQAGRLEIANFGADDDFTLGNNNNTGTLVYTGTGEAADYDTQFRIGDNAALAEVGGGVLLNNGTGAITFNNPVANDDMSNAITARTFELGGTNTDANTISGRLEDNDTGNGATIGIIKSGIGTWVLDGNNTFTGATIINDGTLKLNGTNTTAISITGGALGGSGSTTGGVTFADLTAIDVDADTTAGFETTGVLTLTGVSAGGITVNITSKAAGGAINIIKYASATDSMLGGLNYTLGTNAAGIGGHGGTGTFTETATEVTLDLGFADNLWTGAVNGNWDNGTSGSTANWTNADDSLFFDGDDVTFDDSASVFTVTLNDNVVVGNMDVTHGAGPSTNNYVFNAAGSETITVNGVLSIDVANANTSNNDPVFNVEIAGTGSVFIGDEDGSRDDDSSHVFFNVANSFTGGLTLSEGRLQIGHEDALGTGTFTMNEYGGGGTNDSRDPNLHIITDGFNIDNDIVLGIDGAKYIRLTAAGAAGLELSGNILTNDNNSSNFILDARLDDTITVSGHISGQGGVRVQGLGGTVVLTDATNSFQRGIYVDGNGTLQVASIGDIGVNSHAGAGFTGTAIVLGSGTNSGTLEYTGGIGETNRRVQIGDNNANPNRAGAGTIKNSGSGTFTFDATNFNVALGTTTTDRTLTFETDTTNAGGDIIVSGVIIDNNAGATIGITKEGAGTLTLSGVNTYTGATTINAGTLQADNADALGSGDITFGGGTLQYTTLSAATDWATRFVNSTTGAISLDTNSQDVALAGVIDATNTAGFTKEGAGTLTLTGANLYTGDTTVNGGTLKAGSTTAFGTNSNTSIASMATLLLDGFAQTLGAIIGAGSIVNDNDSDSPVIFTVGGGDGSGDFSGSISDGTGAGGSSALSLIKTGTGTQTLSGTNTYTGTTTVSAGTLDVSGSLTSDITLAAGATLSGEGSTTGLLTLDAAGSIISIDASTPGAFTSVGLDSGNLGTGIQMINIDVAPINASDITVLTYGGAPRTGTAADFSVAGAGLSDRGGMVNDTGTAITISAGYEVKTWDNGSTDSLWTEGVGGSLNWSGGSDDLFYDGDLVTFADAPGGAETISLSNSGGAIAPNSITFDNTAGNSYVFNAATTETLSAAGGITLSATNADAVTFNNVITGATDITHSGSGALTLAGANTYTGTTTLNSGVTTISGDNSARTGATILNSTATLVINDANALGSGTVDINGGTLDATSGDIVNAGNNAQTWDGDFAFTGTNNLDLGTGAVTLGATRTVTTSTVDKALAVRGVISGSGFGLTKEGAGTLTLSGANTFDGPITVNAGVLRAEANAAALSTGTINLAGGDLSLIGAANLNFGNDVNVSSATEVTVDRSTATATTTMTFGALTIDDSTFTTTRGTGITGSNGGVVTFSGGTTITADATFAPNVRTTVNLGFVDDGGNGYSLSVKGTSNTGAINTAANSNYTGGSTIGTIDTTGQAGTLRGYGANSFGTGDITFNQTGVLDLRDANSAVNNNIIVNEGSVTVNAALIIAHNTDMTTFKVANIDIKDGAQLAVQATRGSNAGGTDKTHILNSLGGITMGAGSILVATGGANFDLIIDSATGGIVTTTGTANIQATSADLTINDIISGGANVTFGGNQTTDLGAEGRIILNAQNTYTGNTTISHRTDFASPLAAVVLGIENAFNTMGNLTMNAGGSPDTSTFDMNGFDQTVNALTSSGTASKFITNNGASDSVLTTGSNDGGGNFLHVIQDGATNTIALVKNGIGDLDLGGTNTYTGGTTINGGRIDLNHATDTLSDTGAVTINGGELRVENTDTVGLVTLIDGIIGGAGTLTSGSNYDVRNGTASANLAGTIGLDKTTAGTVTLSGASTYTGDTTVSAGTLDLTGSLASDIRVANGANMAGNGSTTGTTFFGDSAMSTHTLTVDSALGGLTTNSLDLTNVSAGGITVDLTGASSGTINVIQYTVAAGFAAGSGDTFFSKGAGFGGHASGGFTDTMTAIQVTSGLEDQIWTGAIDDVWDIGTTGNWSNTDTFFYDNDTVTFNDASTMGADEIITLTNGGNTITVSNMTIDHETGPASTKNFTFNAATTETLTLTGLLTIDVGNEDTSNNDPKFNVEITGGGSVFIGDGGTGPGAQDDGDSHVFFNVANSFTGGLELAEGRLTIGHEDALGDASSTFTMNESDGTNGENRDPNLHIDTSGFNIDNDIVLGLTGTKIIRLNVAGTGNTLELSGNIFSNDNSASTFNLDARAGDTITVSGNISGQGGVRAIQAGTVKLTDDTNSFQRGVFIDQNATLQVTSIGDVNVNSAAGSNSIGTAGIFLGNGTSSGTFEYTGGVGETNRRVQIGDNNAGIDNRGGAGTIKNSGTGTLTFDATTFNVAMTAANTDRTVTFETDTTNAGGDIVVSGAIVDNDVTDGTIALTKTGAATLTLGGTNTYTGATTVTAGTLLVNGSTASGSTVTVGTGATLGGIGTIGGATTIESGATHTAGTTTGAGTQTFGSDLTINSGSTITWNLISGSVASGTAGSDWDLFDVDGTLAFEAGSKTFDIQDTSAFDFASLAAMATHDFLVWENASAPTGFDSMDFSILYNGGASGPAGGSFALKQDGNNIALSFTAIPEPSTYALMGLGLAAFGWVTRRRRRKQASAVVGS